MSHIFNDRVEAGQALARELSGYSGREDAIVLGLPRGGLPVAYEVATALGLPLDVLPVRKLGLPFQPELAIGAIASGDVTILDEGMVEELGIPREEIIKIRNHELIELDRRERLYRHGRKPLDLRGKLVIIVDDGLATGATMKAAIEAARRLAADRVVVAVPVAPEWTREAMERVADEVVCLFCPEPFHAVGQWFAQFGQVSDKEVQRLLSDARKLATVGVPASHADHFEVAHDSFPSKAGVDSEAGETAGPARRLDIHERHVHIDWPEFTLAGDLAIPAKARGTIVFAHGSGSSRHSPRNKLVARELNDSGFATLLLDLLTRREEAIDIQTADFRFDINLLAGRLLAATDWVKRQRDLSGLPIGYFGASTGAAAALVAAAQRPRDAAAVVSRGGRPDLAEKQLSSVQAPTLLIVGGEDTEVIKVNRQAYSKLGCEKELAIVPGASHLFEEPGALVRVSELARKWFEEHMVL